MTKISNLYALTNQIYVNSSGTAIGIGTTTPSSKLEVAGSIMAHGALTLGSGYALNFYDKGTTAYTWIEGSSYNQSYSFLAFTTGGSEKVRIDSSGNFGIGVAIPSYKLDVNGTARISGAISGTSASFSGSLTSSDALISTDGTNTIRLQKNYFGGIDALYQSGTNAFGIYLGGGAYTAAKLYITNGGNVGIGTTSPYSKLTIHSTASTTLGLNSQSGLVIGQGGATNDLIQIGFNQAVSSTYSPAAISYLITNSGASTFGDILFSTRTSISDVAPTERMRIGSDGTKYFGVYNGSRIQITASGENLYQYTNTYYIWGLYNNANNLNIESAFAGNIIFSASAQTTSSSPQTATERMRITSTGNVGIGTTSPYSPLTVVGNSISWGETATFYPSSSGYTTLAFRLEGTDTTTGTWAIGKESSTGGNTTTQFLQVAKNGLTGSSLYRPDAVQAWNVNGDTSFGFRVLRPAQPAFLAYSGSGGFTVTPGSWYNISTNLTVESYDIGSNYSSGRFTAPVAGRYLFYAGGWTSVSSNGERYAWSAIVNGGSQTFIAGGNFCITDSPLSPYSIVYNLAAGDYVDLHLFSAVGGTFGAGTHRVYWGGYLL